MANTATDWWMISVDNYLLYKYFRYSHISLEMLITREVWFSNPEAFNDPFDCHLNFDKYIPEDKYESCLRWQLKREGRSEAQIEDDLKQLIFPDGHIHEEAKKVIDNISDSTLNVLKNIGVLCLSTKNDSATMWAHYADNHKGFCIGFLIPKEVGPVKVSYCPKAPKVNFSNLFDEPEEGEYKWIFSKHIDWKEENEWRVVVKEGNKLFPIPGRIKQIIFGLRMDQTKRSVIRKILEDENDLEYSETIRNPNVLQLEINPI